MSRWDPQPAHVRVLDRVDVADCWTFTGGLDSGGYGQVRQGGRLVMAHRAVYEGLVGPIPDGLELDHVCRNRACVNPDHLEPVTPVENTRRALRGSCRNGHPLDTRDARQRICSICRRDRWRKWKARQT